MAPSVLIGGHEEADHIRPHLAAAESHRASDPAALFLGKSGAAKLGPALRVLSILEVLDVVIRTAAIVQGARAGVRVVLHNLEGVSAFLRPRLYVHHHVFDWLVGITGAEADILADGFKSAAI